MRAKPTKSKGTSVSSYWVGAELPGDLYRKVHLAAKKQDRSVSALLRELIRAMPEPEGT
jgi:hypothetical protein